MPRRKSKNDDKPSSSSFVAWWTVSSTAFWIVMWGLLEASPSAALNWPMCTVGTVAMMVMISTIQAQLGQRFFKHSMQGWIDSGGVGSLLSIVLLAAVSPITPAKAALILMLPTALVQTVWLTRHVKGAWLWPLASLLLILPAAQYGVWHQSGIFAVLILLFGVAQGLLQGLLISRLWAALPKPDRRKRFFVSDQSGDEAAIQRLSLNEISEEIIDAEPLAQHQSQ
jgi:hypothetical protein